MSPQTIHQQARVKIPARGVVFNADPVDVGMEALRDAQNWIVRRGRFRTRPGLATFTNAVGSFASTDFDANDFEISGIDFALRPMGMYQYAHEDGTTKTVVGTRGHWYVFDTGTLSWTNITNTPLTGSDVSHVIFKSFSKSGETWLMGVNGVDPPKVWDGATPTYQPMGGSPPVARTIAVAANRVLLGNLSTGGTVNASAVDVSNFNDFNSGWGAIQTSILTETPGVIVAMEELSSLSVAIYKTDAVYVCSAVGGIDPFRFELRRAGIAGPASPASVIKASDGSHVYRAHDGSLMRFDGMNVTSISENSRFLFAEMAQQEYKARTWALYDPRYNEVWTFFVDKGSPGEPNVALVDVLSQDNLSVLSTWTMRWASHRLTAGRVMNVETGITFGELTDPWGNYDLAFGEFSTRVERMGLCAITGIIYDDTGLDDLGVAIPHYFELGLSDMGSPGWKDVIETGHYFRRTTSPNTISVAPATSDDGAERTVGTAETFDISQEGPYVVGHRASGRLLTFRVSGSTREPVEWRGGFVAMIPRGLR